MHSRMQSLGDTSNLLECTQLCRWTVWTPLGQLYQFAWGWWDAQNHAGPPPSRGHVNQGVLKCTYLSRWAPSNQLYQFTWGWWSAQRHAAAPLFWKHIYLEGALMHRAKQISTPKSILSVFLGGDAVHRAMQKLPPLGNTCTQEYSVMQLSTPK